MKYELWANKNKTDLAFFSVEYPNYEKNLQLLKTEGDEFELIWTVEAPTHNEAMQKYYDFMGFGKYKPLDDE